MNSNANTQALVRTLIIYAVCVPLAIWIGFMVAGPFNRSTFSYIGILTLVMAAPLLLRWHHFLLIATWNLGMTIFFLPGQPPIWLLMTALSLGISVLHRAVNNNARFVSVPSLTWPLVFFIAVVLFTAKLTGGIGLHSLGAQTVGGGAYFKLLGGILGYFAITAQPLPPRRAKLYLTLFFLGGCAAFISDLAPFLPHKLYIIFAFFPVSGMDIERRPGLVEFNARYYGIALTGMAGFLFMLARYGPGGIFDSLQLKRLWRPVVCVIFFGLIFLGGFRNFIIFCGGVFVFQAYLERFHRTKVFPVFVFAALVGAALLIPFASKLPFTIQRSLAFLPLPISQVARRDAETTKDWRLQIWKDALPAVPKYLLLGRGYALSVNQLQVAQSEAFNKVASDFDTVESTGSYHSGPLSVVIPFGIWGAIAMLWFWGACLRALYCNYRYGDAQWKTANSFLLAYYIAKILLFVVIFGGLFTDMFYFSGIMGLSVALNGGIRRPAAVAAAAPAVVALKRRPAAIARPRLLPTLPR